MDLILNNPFAPVLAACLATAVVLAAAARLIGSAWVGTLAAPVVFLVGYVLTYQKIRRSRRPGPPTRCSTSRWSRRWARRRRT